MEFVQPPFYVPGLSGTGGQGSVHCLVIDNDTDMLVLVPIEVPGMDNVWDKPALLFPLSSAVFRI